MGGGKHLFTDALAQEELERAFALKQQDAPLLQRQAQNIDPNAVMFQTFARNPHIGSNGGTAATAAGLLIFLSIGAKNATLASLIEVTYPIFTAFFAWLLFRQATLNTATVIGAAFIFLGVLIVAQANASR